MKIVMISGHFDPFTDAHLDYLQQVRDLGHKDFRLICIVSSDKQLVAKKGFVNIPEEGRRLILSYIIHGIKYIIGDDDFLVHINRWDNNGITIAKALEHWKPDILFRGGDKTLVDMPPEEKEVCDRLGIKIIHAQFRIDRHGSKFK